MWVAEPSLAVAELVDGYAGHQQQQRLPLEHAERPPQDPLHQHRDHQDLGTQQDMVQTRAVSGYPLSANFIHAKRILGGAGWAGCPLTPRGGATIPLPQAILNLSWLHPDVQWYRDECGLVAWSDHFKTAIVMQGARQAEGVGHALRLPSILAVVGLK